MPDLDVLRAAVVAHVKGPAMVARKNGSRSTFRAGGGVTGGGDVGGSGGVSSGPPKELHSAPLVLLDVVDAPGGAVAGQTDLVVPDPAAMLEAEFVAGGGSVRLSGSFGQRRVRVPAHVTLAGVVRQRRGEVRCIRRDRIGHQVASQVGNDGAVVAILVQPPGLNAPLGRFDVLDRILPQMPRRPRRGYERQRQPSSGGDPQVVFRAPCRRAQPARQYPPLV